MIAGAALAVTAAAAPVDSGPVDSGPSASPPVAQDAAPPIEAARVIASYPHDAGAFTQGLFFHDGRLFESTGQRGQSAIREVDLATGKVKREVRLPAEYFGEGSTGWRDTIISLTWQHGKGFRWDRETFLDHTCRKAGLPEGTWRRPGVELLSFTAEVFGED